jgi:acetyl esterase/lipase
MTRTRTFIVASCVSAILVNVSTAKGAELPYEITPDVIYGHKAGMALTFDVIRPKEPNGAGVMFMMSGAWVSMWVEPELIISREMTGRFAHFTHLLDHGYTLFIVRHGSAPQFKVPEAVADVRRAVRYIHVHAEEFGIDPERLGVCGGSAGGHLSLMLGTTGDEGDQNAQDPIDRGGNRVAAVVAYFPPVDLREWVGDKRFEALHFDPKLAESVSPLLHVTPDDAPTLLVHGDEDGLVKLDNSERILAAFKKENVPCELIVIAGAGHGFPGDDGERATKALVAWFDEHLAADAADGVEDEAQAEVPAAAR